MTQKPHKNIRLISTKKGLMMTVADRLDHAERLLEMRKKVSGIVDMLEDEAQAIKRSGTILKRVKSFKKVGPDNG